jgi:two-component system cell cycle response regulator DivK
MANALILLVEDNDKNRKLVRDVLLVKGYRILEARTAEQGLALAVAEQPQLILMDIQLPDIDGLSALHRLKADVATSMIPVVALTAFAMKEDRERFLKAGFEGYLAKPIDIKLLPRQVQEVIDRHTTRDQEFGLQDDDQTHPSG